MSLTQHELGGYTFIKEIGSGGFATVYLVKKGGQQFAAKVMNKNSNPNIGDQIIKEIKTLSTANHQGIIGLVDLLSDDLNNIYIIQEYVEKSLQDIINERKSFMEFSSKPLIVRILSALRYLHSIGISHRDIKPHNIMVRTDGTIKIIDFGLSKSIKPSQSRCGSKNFYPPEVMEGTTDSFDGIKCDSWSCGVTFYIMLTGKLPWSSMSLDQIKSEKIQYPPYLSKDCIDFLQGLLSLDPTQRPSADQASQHRWLAKETRAVSRGSYMEMNGRITREKVISFLKKEFPDQFNDLDSQEEVCLNNETPSASTPETKACIKMSEINQHNKTIGISPIMRLNKSDIQIRRNDVNKKLVGNRKVPLPRPVCRTKENLDSHVENIFMKIAAMRKSVQ
ncbi:CAMK family protein kinase [Tritrichomonas foetus]|uniref:CAMK family protein kinase n=1 Tax=Tritrichomonas foetus TaxID=1144522 RepID=A0A1J4K986_9EUKA|nr:CAMK family protein kinase [Tritrichomonas foetus]|eukprot:OHT07779.1 CAMK family protein kinase [Tritrichomonas foetus]